jgi:hypothetical protein
MVVSDAERAPPGVNRLKQAAPAAAAAAIVAALVGGSLLSSLPTPQPAAQLIQPDPQAATPAPPPEGNGLVQPQFDQAQGPGGAVQQGVEILVKFKDDKKVKDIIDAFWKDQPSARAKFEAFKAGRPEFANLKLARVTYSNELVLAPETAVAPAQRLAVARDMIAKLKGAADISYAEPNLTAQPGGQ